ncbi:MAG: metallophosphoesterase [Bacteroidetes bacterium]|nr:metallophosphoesterase [Bacteroidota bacterium]
MTSRRSFLRSLGVSSAFLLNGGAISAAEYLAGRSKVKFRFVVASDGHYGQPNTDFDGFHDTLIRKVNAFNQQQKVDFAVINGDLFHDKTELLPKVKQKLDGLAIPYYVTRGNHDHVSDEGWAEVWKMPLNHSFIHKNNAFILGDTSNIKGEYLMPNLSWMRTELDKAKSQKNTFIFLHIPQIPWVEHCIDSPELIKLFAEYPNIRAVFHGHIHSLDGIKKHQGITYLFDAHFGGNWGTEYRGFRVVEVMKDNTILTYMMNPEVRIGEERI